MGRDWMVRRCDHAQHLPRQSQPSAKFTQEIKNHMAEQLPTESYHWEPKLARFCEILGVKPSDYQDSQASQKLQQRLKELDSETLLTLMPDGAEICCQVFESLQERGKKA
jgi:hypothetical protein